MNCAKTARSSPGSPADKVTKLDQSPEYLTGLRVQQLSDGTISREGKLPVGASL